MTERGRDKIITISTSFITSMIVLFVGFSMNSNRADGIELKKEIQSKVPISIYEADCQKNDTRLLKLESVQIEDRQKFIQSVSAIETHLIWIRQELEEQRKARRNK
jgi:hypothetical protein